MRFRSLIFDNFSWKLLSLSLALLIRSGATLFMHQEIRPLGSPLAPVAIRDFRNLPVRFLTQRGIPNPVRIEPKSVTVQVGGDLSTLEHLTEEDTLAFIQLPSEPGPDPTTNRVEVRVPPNVRVLSIAPEHVVVTPLTPPLTAN